MTPTHLREPRSVYVAFEAFPRPKGAASHIASMVTALRRDYAPVLLLCLGFGDMPEWQDEDGIVIHRFKAYHPNMLRRAAEFGSFVYNCLSKNEDGIELGVFRDPWGGAPLLEARPDMAAVFEVNALPSWELAYTYPAFAHSPVLQAKVRDCERFCLARADGVLTVSPVTARALCDRGVEEDRVDVIPNSAPDWLFNQQFDAACLPELEDGTWFGYCGSLHPWQGIEVAIDAFALVAEGLPGARMLIIGGGKKERVRALRKRIRRQGLSERILLHPPMPRKQLAANIAELRFTLAPLVDTPRNSAQGCCPVKIVESLALGVPVIASDLRTIRPLIAHGSDGVLVPPGNRRALAHAIRDLLLNEAGTRELARCAGEVARKRFTQTLVHDTLNNAFARARNHVGAV